MLKTVISGNEQTEPIACSLDGASFKDRMTWIADLNARALKKARRRDLRLELHYETSALSDVRQMIAQEQQCCAFLTFELVEERKALRLTIMAPETAREAAEAVLEPFQAKTPMAASCGCIGGCGT